jgi:hypothetical protein
MIRAISQVDACDPQGRPRERAAFFIYEGAILLATILAKGRRPPREVNVALSA